jgi:hypothetical protein
MKKSLKFITFSSALALSGAAFAGPEGVKVEVLDKSFNPAGGFLAYTEFELSGEPLAESLGLDLDVLDPAQLNKPSAFDYAAGIEAYEYSEEAMYAVNYQSKMGPHLVNGPVNARRGGTMDALGQRFLTLSSAVGFPAEEIPLNMYPLSFPYVNGMPEFAAEINATPVSTDEIDLLDATGKAAKVKVDIPAYFRDFASLGWREDSMDKSFNPAAVAGQMLKDVMWSQDFLGGMHLIEGDEEVEAASSDMDQDGKHALGVSSADGLNGVVLTEIIWDKMLTLQKEFGFDGKKLGVKILPDYSPSNGPIWFPNKVSVTEKTANGVKAIDQLKVTNAASTLRDTWMLLWPLSEVYAYSDQRTVNKNQNPAFLSVFDGAPFPSAPAQNKDADITNDVYSDDPFSLASNLANAVFKNIDALHFNAKAGTLIDTVKGHTVTTYDAAYALQALSIFQRSQDALPVGYASADAGESLNTERGQRALAIMTQQADFIISNLIGKNGLAVDSYDLKTKKGTAASVGTQFAVIRGLTAAFTTTKNEAYKKAARDLFAHVEAQMFDKSTGTYADVPGKDTIYTPFTVAAISSGLRSLMLNLRNEEGEANPVLDLAFLTKRYATWFKTVINGSKAGEGMQIAEWIGDSGDTPLSTDNTGDTDKDGVPQITHAGGPFGSATVMANKVRVSKR